MDLEVLLASANVMQSSIVIITLIANIPQWITIHKNQTSKNISLSSWIMWFLASFFALFYALVNHVAYQNQLALLVTTSVSFFCNAYTIYLILRFKDNEKEVDFVPQQTESVAL